MMAYLHQHFTLNPSKQTLYFWSISWLFIQWTAKFGAKFNCRPCQGYWTLPVFFHFEVILIIGSPLVYFRYRFLNYFGTYVGRSLTDHVCTWTSYWNLRYASKILDNGIYYVYNSSSDISNPEFWAKIRFLREQSWSQGRLFILKFTMLLRNS